MLEKIYCAKCIGIDAVTVTVEVDIRSGIGIHLVGLGDTAVKESLLRTVNALQSLGYSIPGKKIVINLAPADLRKNGSGYDLPIALGIIAASGQRSLPLLGKYVIMGELGLNGEIRDIPGALAYAEMSSKSGFKGCILPVMSALEAEDFRDVEVYGVRTLEDAVRIVSDTEDVSDLLIWNTEEFRSARAAQAPDGPRYMDFSEIIGQEGAKRGAEIAAAGGHNLIMIGPPGSGKSSLAKAMAGILPRMTREESLVTTKIYSVAGKSRAGCGLIRERPVRSPHYSASVAALVGGGNGENILPGEVSLSNAGLLFLDEVAQMPKSAIEALRGPLEDRRVTISRLRSKIEYPASFMLVAASNPCPCGYFGEGDKCRCTPSQRISYMQHLSGPIMDRIDLQVIVRSVPVGDISARRTGECSAVIAERIRRARALQTERFKDEDISTNAEMTNKMIALYCPLSAECTNELGKVTETLGLSMRAYFRIIKVARTIADLAGSDAIRPEHIIEAAGYRFLDRQNIY